MSDRLLEAAEAVLKIAQGCDCDQCKGRVVKILREKLGDEKETVEHRLGRILIDAIEAFQLADTEPEMTKTQMADAFIREYQKFKEEKATLKAENAKLREALKELHDMVSGECPSLLEGDFRDEMVRSILAAKGEE